MIFNSIFLIQIVVTVLFAVYAAISDVKRHYIPDNLINLMIAFGLISNLFLSLITANIKYILASLILMCVTFLISYLLWELNMWGGGDVKLFTGIATVIPIGINIDYLNIFPQLSVYPFIFSVIVNSILVSFPFLLIFMVNAIIKNKVIEKNIHLFVNIFNIETLRLIIKLTLNKDIEIKDLKEGNIVNEYYFNDEQVIQLLNENEGNLKVYQTVGDDDFKYYFKSVSAGGITKKEMYQLKIMNAQGILTRKISVKLAYPFAPSIFAGLIIALFFGDIMMIFSKSIVMVL